VRHITFGTTTPALLAGRKTVTRRNWRPAFAAALREGDLLAAYDSSPRAGGRRVGVIRLTAAPQYERECPPDVAAEHEAEGFGFLAALNWPPAMRGWREVGGRLTGDEYPMAPAGFAGWHSRWAPVWAVRFTLVRVECAAGGGGSGLIVPDIEGAS
jgi:hypothetical protein